MSSISSWLSNSESANRANEKRKRTQDTRSRTGAPPPSLTASPGSSDYGASDHTASGYGPSDYAPSGPPSPIPMATPAANANYPQEVREYWAQEAAVEKARRAADAAERERVKREYCLEEAERLQRVRAAAEIREGRMRVDMQRAQYKKNKRSMGKKFVDVVKDGYGGAKWWWRRNKSVLLPRR